MHSDNLISTWLKNAASAHRALALHHSGRSHPHQSLRAIARIAEEAGVEDHLDELADPLLLIVSKHGAAVIDTIEALAAGSARFRLCLGLVSPNPALPIDPAIWSRLSHAAGVGVGPVPESLETLFAETPGLAEAISSEVPGPDEAPPASADDLDLTTRDWMTYHSTLWASSTVDRIGREGSPKEAVELLVEIADQADPSARSWLGAGTLENLLVYRGAEVIALVEEAAQRSPGFRQALRGVWQRGIPPRLWDRVCAARDESAT